MAVRCNVKKYHTFTELGFAMSLFYINVCRSLGFLIIYCYKSLKLKYLVLIENVINFVCFD